MKKIALLMMIISFFSGVAQEKKLVSALEYQTNLNKEFATKEESPLSDEDFKTFKALDFYPISDKFIVNAKFKRTENEKVFQMKTSTTRLPEYVKYGELTFTIDQTEFKLNIYQSLDLMKKEEYKNYLFLPFSDLTCGKESYIGGRYVDMEIQEGNDWVLDFNKSYNPYCAYNYKYSCPKVPMENDLNVEVLAGVKKFHD